jgi:alpha-methylacyl-CoA racemase
MSVGCLEPRFFRVFIEKFVEALPKAFLQSEGWIPAAQIQGEPESWPQLSEFLSRGFKTASRDYWAKVFHGR